MKHFFREIDFIEKELEQFFVNLIRKTPPKFFVKLISRTKLQLFREIDFTEKSKKKNLTFDYA